MWAIRKWTYLYACHGCGEEKIHDERRLVMAGLAYKTKARAKECVKYKHKEDPSAQYFILEQVPHREEAPDAEPE